MVEDFDLQPVPIDMHKKRQLVPVSKINKNFRSEEEMIEYYELKALDHMDISKNKNDYFDFMNEEFKDEEIKLLGSGRL